MISVQRLYPDIVLKYFLKDHTKCFAFAKNNAVSETTKDHAAAARIKNHYFLEYDVMSINSRLYYYNISFHAITRSPYHL